MEPHALLALLLSSAAAVSALGVIDVSLEYGQRSRLMRSAAVPVKHHGVTSSASEPSKVQPPDAIPQRPASERREISKFASLASRQHHCGLGPVPHYPEVNREHEAVCGNALDACKPKDDLDIMDEEVSEMTELFLRSVVAGNYSQRRELKKRSRALATSLSKDQALRQTYANDVLVKISPISAMFPPGRGLPPVSDRSAWGRLEKANALQDACDLNNLCGCASIMCDRGRIAAVFLVRFTGLKTLAPLANLQRLRVAAVITRNVTKESVKLGVGSLKQLQTLVLYAQSLTRESFSLLALAAPSLRYLDVGLHRRAEPKNVDALPASELEPLCELRELRFLKIFGPYTGLPPCFGNLTKLLHLDIRGLWLTQPLPQSLSSLTQLRTFVAFGQREHHCAEEGCIASIANRVQYETPMIYWCPAGGWNVPLESIMFPEWSKIEKFWVDQNFLHGSIPEWLPDKWRNLRSLDLYSNRITGTVPERLVGMPTLFQLQLHDNSLNGTAPHVGHLSSSLKFLDVSLNPALHGCWPTPDALVGVQSNVSAILLGAHTAIARTSSCQSLDDAQRRGAIEDEI